MDEKPAGAEPSHDDAQRELEQRALRNVRGLVDRIEADERTHRKTQKWIVAGLALVVAVLAGFASWSLSRSKGERPAAEIVVQPPAAKPPAAPK